MRNNLLIFKVKTFNVQLLALTRIFDNEKNQPLW